MKFKFNPIIIAFAIPAVAVVFALVFILLKKSNVVQNAEPFPVASYVSSPRSLEGNNYLLKAQIDSQLAYDPQKGKILSVRTLDGTRLSVFISSDHGANLQVGQRYNMHLGVDHKGLIVVKGLEKY